MVANTMDITDILINEAVDAKAVLVLAHGAGADMEHSYLTHFTQLLNQQHITVLRFNFPYMVKRQLDGKRRPPDRMPTLIERYQTLLATMPMPANLPLFIAGKSMGGRVAAMLANDQHCITEYAIKGVVCIGYPFHPIKKTEKLRLTPLQQTQLPTLILQGERDALGNKEEIAEYELASLCQLHFFADGDHDLKPRVKSGFTLENHLQQATTIISEFIDEHNR